VGLVEAACVVPDRGYGESALRHARLALTRQQSNGWFADCCLGDPRRPLTHTIGYPLRGLLEMYRFTGDANRFVGSTVRIYPLPDTFAAP